MRVLKILAISGSTRKESSNASLLHALSANAPNGISLNVFDRIIDLLIFTIDTPPQHLPYSVQVVARLVSEADGIIFAVQEYVRTLPGGIKNAIDWLVPREELIDKPIAIIHASWRGDDMLADLRRVLCTVSSNFNESIFARFALANKEPNEIKSFFQEADNKRELITYIDEFRNFILQTQA